MNAIDVSHINKQFENFSLQDINLTIKQGYITGLIGPNGAGKSTLLKLMLHIAVPDSGEIKFWGKSIAQNEQEIKGKIGFVSEDTRFYEYLTIKQMTKIIARFYKTWNQNKYQNWIKEFELPENQKISTLSKGMKMKYSLAVALSHEAELLLMDEPTAGLDPIFRRELLDILAELMQNERMTILFSTHITSDLDRIADYITFLHKGRVVFNREREELLENYTLVKGSKELLDPDIERLFLGIRETSVGFEGLMANRSEAARLLQSHALLEQPSLEDIMYYSIKRK